MTGSSVSLPVIKATSFYAIPLHLTHWMIYLRPQGWGLRFCTAPIIWNQKHVDTIKECTSIGDMSAPVFRFCIKIKQESFPHKPISVSPYPGHTITLYPPLMVSNLLPYDFCFYCSENKEKRIPHGLMIPFYTVRQTLYLYT